MVNLDKIIGDVIYISFRDLGRMKDIGIQQASGHYMLKGYDQLGLWLEHPGIIIRQLEDGKGRPLPTEEQTQEEIEQEDKQIELEKATEPEEPEGEDEYQAFVPKNGENLHEALEKVVEKKIVDKEQEEELKMNINDIFKTVLEEGSDDSRAN